MNKFTIFGGLRDLTSLKNVVMIYSTDENL